MGVYLDFKDYDVNSIKKQPQRFKTRVRDRKYVFEISYNRVNENLSLGIYDEAESKLLAKLPVTANVNLAAALPEAIWPAGVFIWGQWAIESTKSIADAFMREFKIYLGGV